MSKVNINAKRLNAIFTAKFISDVGSWIHTVLLLLYANEVSVNKAVGISLVFSVKILMPLLLTPFLARCIDRHISCLWLLVCDLIAAAFTLSIPQNDSLIVTAFLAGGLSTTTAIHFSAFNKLMKILSPETGMKSSILKQSLLEGSALLLGTGTAALIGATMSFKVGFAIDSISFLISMIIVGYTFYRFRNSNYQTIDNVSPGNLWQVLQIPTVPWLLAVSTFAAICFGLRDTTLIQLMVNELHLSKSHYAFAITISGTGGILGNFLASRFSLTQAYRGLMLVFPVLGLVFVGIADSGIHGIFPLLFILGLTEAFYFYFRSHVFFTIVPSHQLAQGAGLFKIFNATSRSAGPLIFGFLFTKYASSFQFLIFAGIALSAAIAIWLFKPKVC